MMQSPVLVERVPVVDIATSAHSSFLEGKWVNTEDELEVIDPATGQPFAKVSKIDHGHLIKALGAAEAAFAPRFLRAALERGAVVRRVADLVWGRGPEFARRFTIGIVLPPPHSEGE